ncbi:hypothetical protein [Hymenobacter negativus]|uniref:Uncharacterized protein n=1 Tax=Hymenobacter negativus TaxID=2795026 RepID=A0ABS3QFH1_9BACT|nr:hypothetical protein [Hymenobacter negativus]MBO2009738.1 hypothetical protein [Hymenobacter negativus]
MRVHHLVAAGPSAAQQAPHLSAVVRAAIGIEGGTVVEHAANEVGPVQQALLVGKREAQAVHLKGKPFTVHFSNKIEGIARSNRWPA